MFLLRQPSRETIRQFIASQQKLPFSYNEVGATHSEATVVGYTVDRNRIRLGDGEHTYQLAVAALRGWKQFELGWVTVVPPNQPLVPGTTVAVQAHTFGFWSLSAARVVYVFDESAPVRRFGFAYGTLPNHVECGEERFSIEWQADDSVWYEIFAFSRPQHPVVSVGFPIARKLQKQFVRQSLALLKAASSGGV